MPLKQFLFSRVHIFLEFEGLAGPCEELEGVLVMLLMQHYVQNLFQAKFLDLVANRKVRFSL